jgi:protein tyrosine/serine phosphatase
VGIAVTRCASMHAHSIAVLSLATFAAACGGIPAKANPDDPAGNFHQVSEGIYRGGRPPDEASVARLTDFGVKTIINLEGDDHPAVEQERGWAAAHGLDFIWIPMIGTAEPVDSAVDQALEYLADENLRGVYVHCLKGMDRTGVIIALHRIYNERWPARKAYDEMEALGFNNLLITLKNYFKAKARLDD